MAITQGELGRVGTAGRADSFRRSVLGAAVFEVAPRALDRVLDWAERQPLPRRSRRSVHAPSVDAWAVLDGGIVHVYGALTLFVGFGPVVATGVAATVVGLATGAARRGTGVHSHVITVAGIIPLLPGLTAYRGFYQLSVEGVADGLVTVTLALAIGLALADGVALGDFVARPRRRASPEHAPRSKI